MFTNPNTLWIEILVVSLVVIFLGYIIGSYIYKKAHNMPTGECEYCHNKNKLLKEYHRYYHNK